MDRGDWQPDTLAPRPPSREQLEPAPGAAQCNYELLRAFHFYSSRRRLRYTLAAGTLLGAMRNRPPGLLQWEHDVDVYMPAADASRLLERLARDCPVDARQRRRSRWCSTLRYRGLVDHDGHACCGFGFKLFHRRRDACELDVLVLGVADAPYMHGETAVWPPWAPLLATPWHALVAAWTRATNTQHDEAPSPYYVLPEDVRRKNLMAPPWRWCRSGAEWAWCGGPALSFFHAEYFGPRELFPTRTVGVYGLRLPVPREPWALLNRTYGKDCAHIARLNEHGHAVADLRQREYAHLREPATVSRRWWWQT